MNMDAFINQIILLIAFSHHEVTQKKHFHLRNTQRTFFYQLLGVGLKGIQYISLNSEKVRRKQKI